MPDLRVGGADELNRLARRLKGGDKALRKELYSGLQRATKPIRADVQRSLGDRLPQRGGFARLMSKARVTSRVKTANRNTRVRIEVASPRGQDIDVRAIDRGKLRHLTFGRRPWVPQNIPPGSVTEPLERGVDAARAEAVAAMARVARQLEG